MINIAQHIRIFDKQPTDELVEKRSASIEAIAEHYSSISSVADILQLAADLAAGTAKVKAFPESRLLQTEELIKEQSSAFVREGQELQILTCSLLAAQSLLSKATPSSSIWSGSDVLAIGLWSSLSFQDPIREVRLESLRQELVRVAHDLVMRSSQQARARTNVPDIAVKSPEAYAAAPLNESIKSGMERTISALTTNAALDREEIDLLWWVLGDWSNFAEEYFHSINPIAAPVYAGLELGTLLSRLPNDAHKHLVMRQLKRDQKIGFHELLAELGSNITQVQRHYGSNQLVNGREIIFPLIAACTAQEPVEAVQDRVLLISEWASRAILESSILHLASLPWNLV